MLLAAEEGRLGDAKELLRSGASVDSRDDAGMTPLMLAAMNGHLEIVEELLMAGADPEAWDCEKRTAVRWARLGGQASAARRIAEAMRASQGLRKAEREAERIGEASGGDAPRKPKKRL